jgi:radical SAM superfamily enzyme YgiQ (UPF0313 family)
MLREMYTIMEILLISLQSFPHATIVKSHGISYIYSILEKHNHNVTVLYLPTDEREGDIKEISRFVTNLNPDLIGFSLMTIHFDRCIKLTEELKKTKIPVIWGGVHSIIAPEECLKYVDMVCAGEGEHAIIELTTRMENNEDYYDVKNIWFFKNGKIIKNPRSVNQNLDELPLKVDLNSYVLHKGKIRKLNKRLYKAVIKGHGLWYDIIASRGCPYSCSYCCNSTFSKLFGKQIRRRSVANVIKELSEIKEQFKLINFQDDCFIMDNKWLEEFCREYKLRINLPFNCRIMPPLVTEKRIKLLKEAGLRTVIMGLQSGSDHINKNVFNRPVTSKQFIAAAKILKKYKILCLYDIITDNPYETENDVLKTIDVLLSIPKPFFLDLFSLRFFPHTALYEKAVKDGIDVGSDYDYSKVYRTYLNYIIMITPVAPKKLVIYLLNNRNPISKTVLRLYHNVIYKLVYEFGRFLIRRFPSVFFFGT